MVNMFVLRQEYDQSKEDTPGGLTANSIVAIRYIMRHSPQEEPLRFNCTWISDNASESEFHIYRQTCIKAQEHSHPTFEIRGTD